MKERILSVGIDIGTTTTQFIISRLVIVNVSGYGQVPKMEIKEKKILYRSPIYITPLLGENEIDLIGVSEILKMEYSRGKISPEQISSGAVIITGESARKRNAKEVIDGLSQIAGDFVVASAGPNLEGVLAGKGSGAAALSLETGKLVANLDIGGGTTNICFFQDGKVVDSACIDIGGRMIRVENEKIVGISHSMKKLLETLKISFQIGELISSDHHINNESLGKLKTLAKEMVSILEQGVCLSPSTNHLDLMKTNQLITCGKKPEIITFSGGVADCIRERSFLEQEYEKTFVYGDLGVLLGEAIFNSKIFQTVRAKETTETINATVIGAGNYSMEVSGSTIEYVNCEFPMKNIPVLFIDVQEDSLVGLHKKITKKIDDFFSSHIDHGIALAFHGFFVPSFQQIDQLSEEIVRGTQLEIFQKFPLLLVMETDMAKVLGQAIKRKRPREQGLISIDGISCETGDYLDLGVPLASGSILPVVVKTLIFQK